MTTMISLVGEQPIPVLLPALCLRPQKTILVCTRQTEAVAKRVARLSQWTELELCLLDDGYRLLGIRDRLAAQIQGEEDVVFNLTGGTKMMMLAAYTFCSERHLPFVYYQTEGPSGRDQRSLLYRYRFDQDTGIVEEERKEIASLINLDDYLRAHVDDYFERGFSPQQGGSLEQAVHAAVTEVVDEVKTGVIPRGVKEQVEIDLLVRCGNHAAILEVKTGGSESGKKAVDQLTTSAAREYLGTYTSRFLVTGHTLDDRYKSLAQALRVRVIELRDYRGGSRLSERDAQTLRRALGEHLPCRGQ